MEGGGATKWADTLFISLLEFEHVPPTDGLTVDEGSFRFRRFKVLDATDEVDVKGAILPLSQTA